MEVLSVSKFSHFELEDMFEDGLRCMQECAQLLGDIGMTSQARAIQPSSEPNVDNVESAQSEPNVSLPVKYLVAGSDAFRSTLLSLQLDPIYCAMMESVLSRFVSPEQLRGLAKGGVEMQESGIGVVVYASKKCGSDAWYILTSGTLKVSLDDSGMDQSESSSFEITAGEIFGGYNIALCESVPAHIRVKTVQPVNMIRLQGQNLQELMKTDLEAAGKVLLMMGGALNTIYYRTSKFASANALIS
jgi:hypothetical protein